MSLPLNISAALISSLENMERSKLGGERARGEGARSLGKGPGWGRDQPQVLEDHTVSSQSRVTQR